MSPVTYPNIVVRLDPADPPNGYLLVTKVARALRSVSASAAEGFMREAEVFESYADVLTFVSQTVIVA